MSIATGAILASEVYRAARQQQIVDEIQQRDFHVIYDWGWDFSANGSRPPSRVRTFIGPNLFASVVIVSGSRLDDDDVELIAQLRSVVEIDVFSTGLVTDRGLARLCTLRQLRRIPAIRSPEITDVGAKEICKLSRLEALVIAGNITSEGIECLVRMPALRAIELTSPHINDNVLHKLEGASQFTTISLAGGEVSEKAIIRLRQSLPSTTISHRRLPR